MKNEIKLENDIKVESEESNSTLKSETNIDNTVKFEIKKEIKVECEDVEPEYLSKNETETVPMNWTEHKRILNEKELTKNHVNSVPTEEN